MRIDWVICGGESERGARPMNPEWAESLLKQCQEAGVPFFFKQWGNWALQDQVDPIIIAKRQVIELCRQDGTPVKLVRIGKKAAGNELNGEVWTQIARELMTPPHWAVQPRKRHLNQPSSI